MLHKKSSIKTKLRTNTMEFAFLLVVFGTVLFRGMLSKIYTERTILFFDPILLILGFFSLLNLYGLPGVMREMLSERLSKGKTKYSKTLFKTFFVLSFFVNTMAALVLISLSGQISNFFFGSKYLSPTIILTAGCVFILGLIGCLFGFFLTCKTNKPIVMSIIIFYFFFILLTIFKPGDFYGLGQKVGNLIMEESMLEYYIMLGCVFYIFISLLVMLFFLLFVYLAFRSLSNPIEREEYGTKIAKNNTIFEMISNLYFSVQNYLIPFLGILFIYLFLRNYEIQNSLNTELLERYQASLTFMNVFWLLPGITILYFVVTKNDIFFEINKRRMNEEWFIAKDINTSIWRYTWTYIVFFTSVIFMTTKATQEALFHVDALETSTVLYLGLLYCLMFFVHILSRSFVALGKKNKINLFYLSLLIIQCLLIPIVNMSGKLNVILIAMDILYFLCAAVMFWGARRTNYIKVNLGIATLIPMISAVLLSVGINGIFNLFIESNFFILIYFTVIFSAYLLYYVILVFFQYFTKKELELFNMHKFYLKFMQR